MQFDDNARLDTSEVRDERGSRIPGGGATIGGGIVGIVVLVVGLVLGIGPDQLGLSSGGDEPAPVSSSLARVEQACRTGQDANTKDDCRIVAVVNSVQDYWTQESGRSQVAYTKAPTVLFSRQVSTACGNATSEVGPFYCPGDRTVYLDLGFFDELRTKFGANGGPFAQAYVVAHEYGHHVQRSSGILSAAAEKMSSPDEDSPADKELVRRIELQAN